MPRATFHCGFRFMKQVPTPVEASPVEASCPPLFGIFLRKENGSKLVNGTMYTLIHAVFILKTALQSSYCCMIILS